MKTIIYTLLLTIAFAISSCEKVFFEEEPKADPIAVFEEFWNNMNTYYVGFEQRNVDWQEMYDTYRPQVNENTSDEDLRQVIIDMLRPLNDGHIKFTVPEQKIFTSNFYYETKFEEDHFSIDVIKDNYFTTEATEYEQGWGVTGRIDNIGYVWFRGVGWTMLHFNTILDNFSDVDGLIIDLRHNGGGDMTYSFTEFSRLTKERVLTQISKTKNGPGKDDFTDWFEWYLEPAGEYFNKPLVLLTDRYTMSAAERATMVLKSLPNLVHMGDTTNGSLSTMIGKELPNGWYHTICPQIVKFTNDACYEGIGLIPDVVVENSSEEMKNGLDKALEEALEFLIKL